MGRDETLFNGFDFARWSPYGSSGMYPEAECPLWSGIVGFRAHVRGLARVGMECIAVRGMPHRIAAYLAAYRGARRLRRCCRLSPAPAHELPAYPFSTAAVARCDAPSRRGDLAYGLPCMAACRHSALARGFLLRCHVPNRLDPSKVRRRPEVLGLYQRMASAPSFAVARWIDCAGSNALPFL